MKNMTLILLLTMMVSGAFAGTYTTTDIVPQRTTNWDALIWLEQFNPSRGELQSMTVTVGGALLGEFLHEITGTSPGTWSDAITTTLAVRLDDDVLIEFDGAYEASGSLNPYDGILDFAGSSGLTHSFSIPLAGGVTRSTGLSDYIGVDMLPIRVHSDAFADLSQTSSGSMDSSATCGVTVSIKYVYTPLAVANENASWSDVKTLFR